MMPKRKFVSRFCVFAQRASMGSAFRWKPAYADEGYGCKLRGFPDCAEFPNTTSFGFSPVSRAPARLPWIGRDLGCTEHRVLESSMQQLLDWVMVEATSARGGGANGARAVTPLI